MDVDETSFSWYPAVLYVGGIWVGSFMIISAVMEISEIEITVLLFFPFCLVCFLLLPLGSYNNHFEYSAANMLLDAVFSYHGLQALFYRKV